jgi:multisubunit Na+/H+ antiporter MnhG subunit
LIFCLAIELLGFAFSGDYSVGSVASILLGTILSFWLLRQTHAGVNWARFAIAFIVVLGILTLILTFREEYGQNPGETIIDIISSLLTLIAVILLFTPESNRWFRRDSIPNRL